MFKYAFFLFMIVFSIPAYAQDIIITRTSIGGNAQIIIFENTDGEKYLRYEGEFQESSGGAIAAYIDNFQDIKWVEFHSPGGVLLEVNPLGIRLREREIPFVIKEGDVCVSACAFLALFSPDIQLNGMLAFHVPYVTAMHSTMTLNEVSQMMNERTMRQTRQMFQNGYLAYLYLNIVRNSDIDKYLVFTDIEELNKYRMTDPAMFMDVPEGGSRIVTTTGEGIQTFISTERE